MKHLRVRNSNEQKNDGDERAVDYFGNLEHTIDLLKGGGEE
jgi:hypothetical protein